MGLCLRGDGGMADTEDLKSSPETGGGSSPPPPKRCEAITISEFLKIPRACKNRADRQVENIYTCAWHEHIVQRAIDHVKKLREFEEKYHIIPYMGKQGRITKLKGKLL